MNRLRVFVVAALAASAFALMPATASAAPAPDGLWDNSVTPVSAIDDGGSVELGVKFQTEKPIYVVGVRFYRIDAGTVSGTLWDANGGVLATDTFGAAPAGWQDLMFNAPVSMSPGETFIASYFAPNADYAYEWDYFTAPRTVGPVTALGGAGVNGVFTYGPASTFPTSTFRDTNYWVTPLWIPQYTLSGFYRPVDMGGVFNTVKGGSTVPLKFEVFDSATGMEQTDVAVVDRFEVTPIACPNGNPTTDDVEFTTTGGTSLRYDFTEGQFIQNWKTPKKPGKCYEVTMFTTDGSSISAKFQLK
jgi:hypothetical protein